MNLTISVITLIAVRKLLTRIRFDRLTLPVLRNVLVTVNNSGITLAVTDLDHWLETRIPVSINPTEYGSFLIPGAALATAVQADKGSAVGFDCQGTAEKPVLKLTVVRAKMPVESVYHPEPASEFPVRPSISGRITAVPRSTFSALKTVAVCSSVDSTRYVLNGVWFTPEDGGMLIATDGRRLAGAPARVPSRSFILPNTAVHVLGHPDFLGRDAAILQPTSDDEPHVQFRSGPHTLIARTIEGHYPGYRQAIPSYLPESVTIPETHRPGLISWLRSLRGQANSVRLTWDNPGHMTVTHWDYEELGACMQVPVTIDGNPPTMAFNPVYLADALQIGSVLHLLDGLNPGKTTDPSGDFCVLMNMRMADEPVKAEPIATPHDPAIAA